MELVDQIVVRLEASISRLLRKVAKARGQDVSNLVRYLIRVELARLSFLSAEEKKALGILQEALSASQKKMGEK